MSERKAKDQCAFVIPYCHSYINDLIFHRLSTYCSEPMKNEVLICI